MEKAKEPKVPTFAMTGYVDTVGPLWKRPGSYKLLMGGKIVGFLRLKDGGGGRQHLFAWAERGFLRRLRPNPDRD